MKHTSMQALLRKRRFLPFFLTQAFGAFNDNLFKNVLALLFTFGVAQQMGLETNLVVNMAAALFIFPFFLLSPLAGQVADKYEKSLLIRRIKLAEIVIMSVAATAFLFEIWFLLLLLLFLMGAQSAFFGPIKYSILPQHLEESELIGGNALVEMATFLAILGGTIAAGILVAGGQATEWAALGVVLFALLGYLASRHIPEAAAPSPQLQINWNPVTELKQTWSQVLTQRSVTLSILAISWFWFLGASYLTQFPNFAKLVLQSDATVVTLLLTLFSVGIALGSWLCEKLSRGQIELGVVPIGAFGVSLFGAQLALMADALPQLGSDELRNWLALMQLPLAHLLMLNLALLGVSGGLFIVPLYALIQKRTAPEGRAQVIAMNNVMNAVFMVGSALLAIVFLNLFALSIPNYFLVLSIMKQVAWGNNRAQIPVTEFMTPKSSLSCVKYTDLKQASIKDVIQALESLSYKYLLVTNGDCTEVRGLFSATEIIRKLENSVTITPNASFSQLFTVISR